MRILGNSVAVDAVDVVGVVGASIGFGVVCSHVAVAFGTWGEW